MASVIERNGKYRVTVRMKGFEQKTKTFAKEKDAIEWGDRYEESLKLERGDKVSPVGEANIVCTDEGVISLTTLKDCARPYTQLVGVYFLFRGDKLIYIGSSKHFQSRLINHTLGREKKIFDRYVFVHYPTEEAAKQAEIKYIKLYNPTDNMVYIAAKVKKQRMFKISQAESSYAAI